MTSEKASRKDKNQNIQVFVRLRPLNQRERDIKSLGVVEVVNGREILVRQSQQTSHTKKFTFDRAFGPHAKQVEVYQEVVSPLIEEVLAGYNCTVFAYGQTGTGKTHTMVGENTGDETNWQSDPLAGIIPRALSQLFDELRLTNTEYTVRVSYLELYNEELFDLLSSCEDNSKLRIYEDVTRKGSNIVNGLEEITVYNKNEVYKIMAQGQERKRVASTLMNAQSSRSHTVFTIVVHMKENSPEGEELVKIGKLNLVDLAGSENISKAGSDNPARRERARECVNINQSLLTLGRVITALVERHPHIPYRESKLTRILQESLGGRTKTSIIATISPGHKDLEETMSTLEYANRAKNIQNKPEINQKMTKKAILKEYAEEIDRLKRDLQAARDKNGVYLANETYAEMTLQQEEQRKEIQELLLRKRALEEERDRMESIFSDLGQKLQERESELNITRDILNTTKTKLVKTNNVLQTTKLHFEEQKYLVERQMETENTLTVQAKEILAAADMAATHVECLHDNVDKRKSVETTNLEITNAYREMSSQHRDNISGRADNFVAALTRTLGDMQTALENHTSESLQSYANSKDKLEELVRNATETINMMSALESNLGTQINGSTSEQQSQVRATLQAHGGELHAALQQTADSTDAALHTVAALDLQDAVLAYLEQWHSSVTEKLGGVRASASEWERGGRAAGQQRADAARRVRAARRERCQRTAAAVHARIALIMEDKEHVEQQLMEQLADVEKEKADTESRLTEWAEEERRLLEERIASHVTKERTALEDRLKKRKEKIEEQRRHFEERISHALEWLNAMLRVNEQENQAAEEDLNHNMEDVQKCLQDIDTFIQQCDKGVNAVTTDLNSLSANVLNVVGQIKSEMVDTIHRAKNKIQMESNGMISSNKALLEQLIVSMDTALNGVAHNCKQTMNKIVHEVNENSTCTIQQLSSLRSNTVELQALSQSHLNTQNENLTVAQRELEQFYSSLREEINRQAELEGKCLKEEYRIYSPTGRTPMRTQYRYPRRLAATSPHDRVLERFRAMRRHSNDDDCIVVECEESRASDSEGSGSDDSAVVFTAPSPPPSHPTIVKCTSETDIYLQRRRQEQQGKENVNRSVSFKKPSKLPAPTSNKKPLVERNMDK
ncbi:unnamed protein product [Parnassius mnemosyne]|uniref:Kinesin motor domain-containing protein n=1 Tax=Parnassius mnemosyne TaxID=213953 RepID=A0AAV1LJD4_9NEOP